MTTPPPTRTHFHVGLHHLHHDASINFQLNRWIAWTGGDSLADIQRIAPRLTDYATNRRLFLQLAESALADGDMRRGARSPDLNQDRLYVWDPESHGAWCQAPGRYDRGVTLPVPVRTPARPALRLAGLLVVLAALFGMHGLSGQSSGHGAQA